MKLTNEQLKQIIREELEVVLTNEEAGEIFGDEVQRQLEEDEAGVEEGHCPGSEGEPPPREPADIVMALEKAMRALGDALEYMRGEHMDALGDVAGDMADQAAMMNVGPMEEGALEEGFKDPGDFEEDYRAMIPAEMGAKKVIGVDVMKGIIKFINQDEEPRDYDMNAETGEEAKKRKEKEVRMGLRMRPTGRGVKLPPRGEVYRGADTSAAKVRPPPRG